MKTKSWEKEFSDTFEYSRDVESIEVMPGKVKDFIKSLLHQERERGLKKIWDKWCDLSGNPEITGVEQCIEFDAWMTKLVRLSILKKRSKEE